VTATTTRRLLIPGLMTLVMLATLLTLGTWQVSRLLWKQGLLAAIAAGEQRPPVPLGESPPAFTRVRAEGRFKAITALYGAEVRGNNGGARLLGILQREGAPPVLVDRGWVPVPLPPLPPAPTAVEGYIRPAETPGPFAPTDDLAGRRFYTLNPEAIGRALGVPNLAPYTLVAMSAPGAPPATPDPARTLPRPPNNHLTYAITWYGLAIALLVVFALYARKVRTPESQAP
jgi:surfeit locus 1 family protein